MNHYTLAEMTPGLTEEFTVTVTPESSSASMRLGLSVWSRPRTGSSFPAFAAETGSAKSGAVQYSPR